MYIKNIEKQQKGVPSCKPVINRSYQQLLITTENPYGSPFGGPSPLKGS